ncbi:MAG: spore germination protein [Acutalibacteraceae bacterium]|nr:spore germination protein [Acutalibacteraceae bacterium]
MNDKVLFSDNFYENEKMLDEYFRTDRNFDVVNTRFHVTKREAKLYYIDGFVNNEISERVMNFMMSTSEQIPDGTSPEEFVESVVSYIEMDVSTDMATISKVVYSGAILMIVDGFSTAFLIKTRNYPRRSVQEPDNDKVLRGAHDGFVEALLINTALIRRRIRDRDLIMEVHEAGKRSRTDIAICYLDGKADMKTVKMLRKKISEIDVNTLSMSQESLIECLVKKQIFNPFPKVRYTERPDSAAACIAEGSIILLVDNSPAAMIVPTSFFEFLQDTNDYYFPPLVGTYLRLIRGLIFGLALLLSPTWYLLISNPDYIPEWLSFITIKEQYTIPVIAQLLIIELVIDTLKSASLNTPNALSNSFSVIGALVLGDLAVTAKLFSSEVVLFMAFVAIANFAQPSFELGYAFKLSRIFILILTAIFNLWGFIAGLLIVFVQILCTKTVTGRGYLYPLIPFNARTLFRLLVRYPISKDNT